MRRAEQDDLAAGYTPQGAALGFPPEPVSTTAGDVLEYLEACHFNVYAAPPGEGMPKYVYQGQLVTLEKLVSIANQHRAIRRLPPFKLAHQFH